MSFNKIFDSLLDNREDFEFLRDLSLEEVDFLKKVACSIDTRMLYMYEFHGVYHSQKVLLFGYLLSKRFNLSDDDIKILVDAFVLHDCGRTDDCEDSFHGLAGANKLAIKLKNDPFYSKGQNLKLLCAIVDAHSADDRLAHSIALNYDLEDEKVRFDILYKILKDADALDRTRFPKSISEAIKERYLRFDYSRKLISFAYEVNRYYTKCITQSHFDTYAKDYLLEEKQVDFLHSIGWDFSKFESILEHGILSEFSALSRGIAISRNFDGNNSNMWLSVVSGHDVVKKGSAYETFLLNGIDFYGVVSRLCAGEEVKSRAHSLGLPRKSGEYEDESFAFYEVPKDDILSIIIPQDKINSELKDLNYLGCAHSYSIISSRTDSYIKYIKNITGLDVDNSQTNKKIEELKKIQLAFSKKSDNYQRENLKKFIETIDNMVLSINTNICDWMDCAFSIYFGLEDGKHPTVGMMVTDILKRKKIDFQMYTGEYEDDCTTIFLNTGKTLNKKIN